jgi:3-(3-hydroxy-phenyl)propionate hydroxylase
MMGQGANRVIVAGCGPVGAVMALALVKKGISVALIEQLPDAAEDQRAATIHPPTVEMLVGLGLVTEMFSEMPSGGMPAPLFHYRDRATGELVAEFDINLLKGEVPYPYVLQWEQYKLVHAALPYNQRERHWRHPLFDQAHRARANKRRRRGNRYQCRG